VVIYYLERDIDETWRRSPVLTQQLASRPFRLAIEYLFMLLGYRSEAALYEWTPTFKMALDYSHDSWIKFRELTTTILEKCFDSPSRISDDLANSLDKIYVLLILDSEDAIQKIRESEKLCELHARMWLANSKLGTLPYLFMHKMYPLKNFMKTFQFSEQELARILSQPIFDANLAMKKKSYKPSRDAGSTLIMTLQFVIRERPNLLGYIVVDNMLPTIVKYGLRVTQNVARDLALNPNHNVNTTFEVVAAIHFLIKNAFDLGPTYVNQAISAGYFQMIVASGVFWIRPSQKDFIHLEQIASRTKSELCQLRKYLYHHRVIKHMYRSPKLHLTFQVANELPCKFPYDKDWFAFAERIKQAIRLKGEYAAQRTAPRCDNEAVSIKICNLNIQCSMLV
jgi:hypothetical protein